MAISLWLICGGLAIAAAATALGEAFGLVSLPEALEVLDRRLPFVFRLHMGFGATALALVVAAISVSGRPRLHRPIARAAALSVAVAGLTALPAAFLSVAPPAARLGFFVQGLIWLGLLAAGYVSIRRGYRAAHRRIMIALGAVTAGAVVLRLLLFAASYAAIDFDVFYGAAAWAAWLAPLALALALTRRPATH